MSSMTVPPPAVRRVDDGETYWWTGEWARVVLTAEETGGAFSLVEVHGPPGLEVPLHVHRREDETFWVVDGSATFSVGGREFEVGPGDTLFGPRDVPHGYRTGPDGVKLLYLFTPGGFEGFVRATGSPARDPRPAEPIADGEAFAAAARAFDVALL